MKDKSTIQLGVEEPSAVMLGFIIQRLGNYEPGLVDIIYWLIHIKINDVGEIPAKKYEGNLTLSGRLIIPNSATTIGESVFEGCIGLTSVEIPNSVTTIGYCAFYKCSGLTSVEIPNSVTYIGDGAFYECSELTSVEIPNSVTKIESYAFWGCRSLTSVEIPHSVIEIEEDAFPYECEIIRT
jgi:hypothetical protein